MRSTMQSSGIRRRSLTTLGAAALIGVSAVLATGCDDKDGTPVANPSVSAPSSVAGGPQASSKQATVRTVGKTGWWDGFEITLAKATIVPSESGGGKFVADIAYRNTTGDNKTLTADAFLQFGTEVDATASWDYVTVPGKGSANGTVTTSLKVVKDPQHLLDQMTLVFGQASQNQTKLPVKAAAPVESVQPKALAVTGRLVQDQTTIEITGGNLTPSYAKDERGKMLLSLHVKIIGGPGVPAGGLNIFDEYFSMRTPDGQQQPADTRSYLNELLEKNQTIDNPKNFAVFLVPSPGTGSYVLSYNASKEADPNAPTLPFTVG